MKEGWVCEKLSNCIKLKSGDGLTAKKMIAGDFLVFGGNGIAGYHNAYNLEGKNIIIGRVGAQCGNARFIDEKIWLTDNAFKISEFKYDFNFQFLNYLLNHVDLRSYARQAAQPVISNSSLKNVELCFPTSVEEQKQIVAILDKSFAAIDQAKANIEKNIENAKELFDSKKAEYFERLTLKNELSPITETCEKIFAGGDKPKPNFSKIETDEYKIPVISNGEKNDGLFGYTDIAKVLKPAITVSARGTIGYTSYRDYPFVPIVRLIVLIPKTEIIDIEFLMYAIKNLDILRTGSSIPQLTVPMIKSYSIPVPSKEEQKEIVECLNQLEIELEDYKATLEKKLLELEDLKKSILQKAFSGELTSASSVTTQKPVTV